MQNLNAQKNKKFKKSVDLIKNLIQLLKETEDIENNSLILQKNTIIKTIPARKKAKTIEYANETVNFNDNPQIENKAQIETKSKKKYY